MKADVGEAAGFGIGIFFIRLVSREDLELTVMVVVLVALVHKCTALNLAQAYAETFRER